MEQEIWNLAADHGCLLFCRYLSPAGESGESGTAERSIRTAGRCSEVQKSFIPSWLKIPAEERQRFLCCQADDHRHWVSDGDEVFGSFLGGNGSKASMERFRWHFLS
ncbi:MAG: hypothetical protein ACLR6B_01690 [Blautia sp.]